MPQRLHERLLSWASILDDRARAQAITTASMPFIHPHVALMPDAHLGKGATVGSVIPTEGAIIPAAVGVDIGCGMMAVRTQYARPHFLAAGDSLARLRQDIERRIPMSAGRHNSRLYGDATVQRVDRLTARAEDAQFDPASYAGNWRLQLGSLGSGNHFIEVTVDEQDRVWLFLHSGSRGVGNKIAQRHIAVAARRCRDDGVELPDRDLAFLTEGTREFDVYIAQMTWAQEFARANRDEMMDRVVDAVERWTDEPVVRQEEINCHHNFTQPERHFGRDVWLSRKGAIQGERGQPGLIPGSMGTASYVVAGKGDADSLNSSPHGAGRSYSRSAARKRFTQADLRAAMKGIEYRDTTAFIDEIPAAYKDIDVVMDDAADLVTIRHTLRQILNCKGD